MTVAPSGRAPTPVPTLVLAAVVVLTAASACYSILVPAWRAPDEAGHVDLVYQVAENRSWPSWDDAHYTQGVENRQRPTPPQAADDVPDDRPSLGELGGAAPSRVPNHISQHPPTYYVLGAAVLAAADPLLPGDPTSSAESTVGLLRLGNTILLGTSPLLAWFLARRCGAPTPVALTAAAVPLLLPGYAQMGGVVNNDNLLVVPVGLAMLGLVAIADGDRRPWVAVATGTAMGFALVTKATAVFVAVPAALVVFGLLRRRETGVALRTALRLALPPLALSGWWYVPKLVREGRPVPSRIQEIRVDVPVGSARSADDFGHWLRTFLEWTSDTFVSRSGIVEVELPDWVTIATASAVAATLVVAVVWPFRAGLRPGRRQTLVLVSPLVIMYATQAYKSWESFSPTAGLGPLLNARYLYAFMVPMAVVVARGLHVVGGRIERHLPLLVIGVGGALHVTAAVEALDRFWGVAPGVGWVDLEALVAWSPWPAPFTVVVFASAAGAVVALGVAGAKVATAGVDVP